MQFMSTYAVVHLNWSFPLFVGHTKPINSYILVTGNKSTNNSQKFSFGPEPWKSLLFWATPSGERGGHRAGASAAGNDVIAERLDVFTQKRRGQPGVDLPDLFLSLCTTMTSVPPPHVQILSDPSRR